MSRFLVSFFLIILANANLIIARTELPLPRKLGDHNLEGNAGHVSSEAPESSEVAVSASDEAGAGAPEQVMPIVHRHHKLPFDKSVCGGGVILGGLACLFLLSIFCYIRATRRIKNVVEPESSPVSSSSYAGRKRSEPRCPSNVMLTCHVEK